MEARRGWRWRCPCGPRCARAAHTPRKIGMDAHDAATRAFYDDRATLDAARRELAEQRNELAEQRRELARQQQDEMQRELLALFKDKDEERESELKRNRSHLFCESILSGPRVVEPFGLGKGVLQTWLREKMTKNGDDQRLRSLGLLVDKMGDVDGLTILSDWARWRHLDAGVPRDPRRRRRGSRWSRRRERRERAPTADGA